MEPLPYAAPGCRNRKDMEKAIALYLPAYRAVLSMAPVANVFSEKIRARMLDCGQGFLWNDGSQQVDPAFARKGFVCERAIPCIHCRYRLVLGLLTPYRKNSARCGHYLREWEMGREHEQDVFLRDYETVDSTEFPQIQKYMDTQRRTLLRRLDTDAVRRLSCLNIEYEEGRGFFYRFRQAIVCWNPISIRSRAFVHRKAAYEDVVRTVFRYPDAMLAAPLDMFSELFLNPWLRLTSVKQEKS